MKRIVIRKTFQFERRCPDDLVAAAIAEEVRSIEDHMSVPAAETLTVEVKDE